MLTIRGIRLDAINIPKPDDDGRRKVSGQYALISTAEKVLATQPFNTYGGIDITPSPATIQALDRFLALFSADVSMMLGFGSEVTSDQR